MARFQSQVYTAIRGSIGGITYTKNQFQSLIAKARVAPTNPRTNNQTLMRSAFAGASQMWTDATPAVRAAWEAYADNLVYHGPLSTFKLPGRQVFLGNLAAAIYYKDRGLTIGAILNTPPSEEGFLELSGVTATRSATVGTGITVNATVVGSEPIIVAAQISNAFNTTRERFNGPFVSSTLSEIDCSAAPVSAFEDFLTLIEDKIYFAQLRAISAGAPYRMSPYYVLRAPAVLVGA